MWGSPLPTPQFPGLPLPLGATQGNSQMHLLPPCCQGGPPPQGGCPLMGGARSPLPSALGSCCRAEPWPHRPDPMLQLGWRAAGSLPWSRASECHACLGTELLPSPPHPRLSTPTPRPPCLFLPPLDPGQPPLSDSFSCHSAPGGGGSSGRSHPRPLPAEGRTVQPSPPPGKGAGRHPL